MGHIWAAARSWPALFSGGAEGNRTPDLCSAIAALSHLSYGPGRRGHLVGGPCQCQGRPEPPLRPALPCRRAALSSTSAGDSRTSEGHEMLPILYFIDQYLIDLFI